MFKSCLDIFRPGKETPYPKAVVFIVANEFCERFNYYGMRTILALYLRNKIGLSEEEATLFFHVFSMLCYFFPLAGAIIADSWWGKYRTILYLSIVYVSGSVLLAVTAVPPLHIPAFEFSMLSMMLIAVGTGGIKPCVSAFGGDQFKLPEQEKFLNYYFSVFYFAINAGSLISTFLTPILRSDVNCFGEYGCYSLAFAVPGLLMITAVIFFVAGKKMYKIMPPLGFNLLAKVTLCIARGVAKRFKSKEKRPHWLDHADDKYETKFIDDVKSLLSVLVLFIPIPVFWALFDQQGSRWTFQADRMNQELFLGLTIKPDQMQVINPFLILVLLPLYDMVIYPFLAMIRLVTKPTHKILGGGILAAVAFVISGFLEIALVPTYETPLTEGQSQLRVYNGYNCRFTITVLASTNDIGPLEHYQNLNVPVKGTSQVDYTIKGVDSGTPCSEIGTVTGTFNLQEKTANSYFINRIGVTDFIDNTTKPMDGVRIRFLVNSNKVVPLKVIDNKNKPVIDTMSDVHTLHEIKGGAYDIQFDNTVVTRKYPFKAGGVYSVNVYGDNNNNFVLKSAMTTPWNSIHILWQIPQYLVMTMAEVMLSVTGLSFSFTQAPISMKSVLQSIWLLTVTIGNLIVIIIVKGHAMDAQWKEFFLFAALMGLDMLLFAFLAWRYKYKVQDSTENAAAQSVEKPKKSEHPTSSEKMTGQKDNPETSKTSNSK